MSKPKNLSLQKKTSARVAAVQCLYEAALMEEKPNPQKLVANFTNRQLETLRTQDEELSLDADPDMNYFKKIVEGVCEHHAELDGIVQKHLHESWPKDRMSPLLLSILLVALYELKYNENLQLRIVLDEYVTLTGSFFAEAEVGFVNAFLDKAGKEIRPGHA